MSKKEAVPVSPLRVVKINTCSSLSGRSQIAYKVGCSADSEVAIRVSQNSSSGAFAADWVPLRVIEQLILDHPADKPMSARVLSPVYAGRSSNSCGFLFACCLAEGLVKPGADKDSGYQIGDIEAFKQAMSALIASDTNLDAAASPEVPKRKRKET